MKILKKHLLIGTGVFAAVVLLTAASLAYGISFTGFFKAFDKTLSPGEYYERNITVRKFYNVSVRFQKEGSDIYLGFDDNDSVIVLKDGSGSEILNVVGVQNGRIYAKMTNYELSSVTSVSAYSIKDYEDVVDHPVNDTVLSFIGAKAYITIGVQEKVYETSTVTGYIFDDLTGDALDGITVAAFDNDADPTIATAIQQSASDVGGRYMLTFELDDSKALDVYVDGYDVV